MLVLHLSAALVSRHLNGKFLINKARLILPKLAPYSIRFLECLVRRFLLFVLTSLLVGCVAVPVPHERQVTPLYFGKVSDADSNVPIKDAKIIIKSIRKNPETNKFQFIEARTDKDGNYKVGITENAIWFILWFGPAEGYCGGTLIFEHKGYQTQEYRTKKFGGAAVDGVCTGRKIKHDVLLQKVNRKDVSADIVSPHQSR